MHHKQSQLKDHKMLRWREKVLSLKFKENKSMVKEPNSQKWNPNPH